MNRMLRALIILSWLVLLTCCRQPQPAKESTETRILWDTYGVPHIFAPNNEQALYAFGWASAHSHGDLILRLYGQARGRAAEYWGDKYLDGDRWMQRMSVPSRAEAWARAANAEERACLEAYARGINDYVAKHADRIDDEVEVVLPVSITDLMAHSQRVVQFTFMAHPGKMKNEASLAKPGSNAWAIAPSRSKSGNSLLLANPHLPWSDLFRFYEAQIKTPDMDFYGTGLVGHPVLSIGFNDNLGWSHTVNTHDGQDLFMLEPADGGYLWNGERRQLEKRQHTLKIREKDGSLREEILEIQESICGPIIAEEQGKLVALKVVGLDAAHMYGQYMEMAAAKNLVAFEKAQSRLQMPMFTTMYADRDGHIMHLFGGLTPRRANGDWKKWSRPVSAGGTGDVWTETHAYNELPQVIDPASGWLQNANDPPWTTTFPIALKADDYPAYMAPRAMSFRAQSSARLLSEDNKISLEELVRYKHSTRMEAAERLLDDLQAAVEKHGDDKARQAIDVLNRWDRQANADSVGALLFSQYFNAMRRTKGSGFATNWSEEQPRTTPDGFADPKAAAALLSSTAAALEKKYGKLDVAWGEVHRLRIDGVDLPASGGHGRYGIFRVFAFADDSDGKRRVTMGDSFVAAVEFGEQVKAHVLLSYGNSSQPGSSHRSDQLNLLSQQKLRDAWRTESEIRANLESEEVLPF